MSSVPEHARRPAAGHRSVERSPPARGAGTVGGPAQGSAPATSSRTRAASTSTSPLRNVTACSPRLSPYIDSSPGSQGQSRGRCWIWRCAECATRAGVLISWARRVAVRARVWRPPARTPAARVRLWEIAAQTSQAAFAANRPEGRCASGPFFSSAMTCSMMACGLRGQHRLGVVGEHGVVAVDRERFGLPGRDSLGVEAPHAAHDQPGGDVLGAAASGERGERHLGDFGIGDPLVFVLVEDGVGVADRRPAGLVDAGDGG
jgi:hypothetical protein